MRLALIGLLITALVLASCAELVADKRVVSCPTMRVFAERMLPEATHLQAPSTAEALRMVREREADIAIVGRMARPHERGNLSACPLARGMTLIKTGNDQLIAWDDLREWRIHTTMPLDNIKHLFPEGTEIVTGKELGPFDAALIAGEELTEDDALLIPMQGLEKDPRFRSPFLYTNTETPRGCCENTCPWAALYAEVTA